jgi:hypothetical protein
MKQYIDIAIEEDGDEIFTKVKYCTKWPCCWEKKPLIKNHNGFMICPICKGSYGKRK